MRIVIIDTGIDVHYFDERIIGGVTIVETEDGFAVKEGYKDYIGHGTGTADIILKHASDVELFEVKVYDKDIYISQEKLSYALNYIKENITYDLIQISSGIPIYSKKLHEIVREIVSDNRVSIISAYDNEGAISYPAALEEVIGVDVNYQYIKKNDFDIIEGNVVDVRGGDIYHRMAWLNDSKNIAKGSSFLTSYITALISNLNLTEYSKENILKELSKHASQVYKSQINNIVSAEDFVEDIHKAIVFPFNKEVHSIAAFEDMLSFEIMGYYDIKHKFLVGRKVSEVLKYTDNNKLIDNYENIDWSSDFDTIICGHVGEIKNIIKRDLIGEILEKCTMYGKKVYFLDDLSLRIPNYINTKQIFCPLLTEDTHFYNHFGKLRVSNKPVLAVMGTSSKQGKFTVQLQLLRELKKRGINVDGIGSEPTSAFFGYTQMFPFGYGTSNRLSSRAMIRTLNDMVWKLESKDVDLILSGCQSGTVAYDMRHESLLPVEQYNYILGVNPDGVILCVNEVDELSYIKRTIHFIEAAGSAKVIAIVMSSTQNMFSYSVLGKQVIQSKKQTLENMKQIEGKPIFLFYPLEIDKLVDVILEYYS